MGEPKIKPEPEKAAVRAPFSLGKNGEVRVTILAKPGARLSAITGFTQVGAHHIFKLKGTVARDFFAPFFFT